MSDHNSATSEDEEEPLESWIESETSFKFAWKIENFTEKYEESENGKSLRSSIVSIRGPDDKKTHWRLSLYPKGRREKDRDYLSVYLRLRNKFAKEEVSAEFQLSILDSTNDYKFTTGVLTSNYEGKVLGRFVKYERLKTLSSQLLPNDNLTIVCDVTIFGERKPVLYCNEEQLENGDVSQDLEKAFTSKELCDVQLQCGEKIFDCHKFMLSARSPVFRAMFQAEMEEKKTNKVDINDLDPDILAEMLHFIYTGKTPKLDDFA